VATINFSIPEDVKRAFNQTFAGSAASGEHRGPDIGRMSGPRCSLDQRACGRHLFARRSE
jgi:hypothetical protein